MTEKETAVDFDPVAASRIQFPMFFQMQPVLKILAQRCLFDGKVTSEVLPQLEVVYIYCAKAQRYFIWCTIEMERRYNEHLKLGHNVRPIRFLEIEVREFGDLLSILIMTPIKCLSRFTGTTLRNSLPSLSKQLVLGFRCRYPCIASRSTYHYVLPGDVFNV